MFNLTKYGGFVTDHTKVADSSGSEDMLGGIGDMKMVDGQTEKLT